VSLQYALGVIRDAGLFYEEYESKNNPAGNINGENDQWRSFKGLEMET
jgi:hypothetical protein